LAGDDGSEGFKENFVVSKNFIERGFGIQINQTNVLELFGVILASFLAFLDHREFLNFQKSADLWRFFDLTFFTYLGFV